jgi:4-hydroxybenzoate polyprenyltransferase
MAQRLNNEIAAAARPMAVVRLTNNLRGLLLSLRPHQWVKNSLVFGALIFSRSLSQWGAARLSLGAFIAFSMASSGVYLLNDLCDLEADRQHPVKRRRPLAAGVLNPMLARAAMVLLLASAVALSLMLRPAFAIILSVYLLLNLAYSFGVKRVVILDVMLVAIGFVLRAVAGAVVIGVQASPWLILCTLMLALLMGFGKRRHELTLLQEEAQNHRHSLDGYSVQFLDLMMTIAGGAAVVTYALYTMAEETVARFHTRSLILTIPFVLYGVFRYLYLVHKREGGGDPARMFVTDAPTLANVGLWIVTICLILYGPRSWQPW